MEGGNRNKLRRYDVRWVMEATLTRPLRPGVSLALSLKAILKWIADHHFPYIEMRKPYADSTRKGGRLQKARP